MENQTDILFSCPGCGQSLSAPVEMAGMVIECPHCHQAMTLPGPSGGTTATTEPVASSTLCSICQTAIAAGEAKVACPECHAEYHEDCWRENGGCAVYGCSKVPATEKRAAVEIPVSYWGQENKTCPVCKTVILAAAVRCRICGSTFVSARPEHASEFQDRAARLQRQPTMRKMVVCFFIFSLLPCSAPLAAIVGGTWYFFVRQEINALPSLYGALSKIGLVVGVGQTVFMFIAFIIAALHG